jgi:hypothetical protein
MKKRIGVAMLSALVLTLVIAGVAGAVGPVPPNGGNSYQPQPYYNHGYSPNTGQPGYAFPGNGTGTNRGTPAYAFPGNGTGTNRGTPAYTLSGNGNGVCSRFGGGYGFPCRQSVTPYSGGWTYWGY